MRDGTATPITILAGAFAVICCAVPLLIAAIGTAALIGWLMNSAYVLIPASLVGLGLWGLWFYRRRTTSQDCCNPTAVNKAPNHE